MNILTLWVWAFGFAILKHLWENNPKLKLYAYEKDKRVRSYLKEHRSHPIFHKGYSLPSNIKILDTYEKEISRMDVLIIALPVQCIREAIESCAWNIPSRITIVNLSKGIDIQANKTVSQLLSDILKRKSFHYCVFSWGVFGSELVAWRPLWADLWTTNRKAGNEIKKLFHSSYLEIELKDDYVNIELYGSFKNILAIIVWYYQSQGEGLSSISYRIFLFMKEVKELIRIYDWDIQNFDFASYSLWGDLITTCFWDSRNRYLGNLLWSWKSIKDALAILKSENKHAEWYETIHAVYKKVQNKGWFEMIKLFYDILKN